MRRLLTLFRSSGRRPQRPPQQLPRPPDVRLLAVDAGWTPEQCLHLIFSLTPGQRLSFFDPTYPSVSDPGGYIQVCRASDGGWLRYAANHGWHTAWEATTPDALALLMYAHRTVQGPGVQLSAAH